MLYVYAATEEQGEEFLKRFSEPGKVVVWRKFREGQTFGENDTIFFLEGVPLEMEAAVRRNVVTSYEPSPKVVDFRDIERKQASVKMSMKIKR